MCVCAGILKVCTGVGGSRDTEGCVCAGILKVCAGVGGSRDTEFVCVCKCL